MFFKSKGVLFNVNAVFTRTYYVLVTSVFSIGTSEVYHLWRSPGYLRHMLHEVALVFYSEI